MCDYVHACQGTLEFIPTLPKLRDVGKAAAAETNGPGLEPLREALPPRLNGVLRSEAEILSLPKGETALYADDFVGVCHSDPALSGCLLTQVLNGV